MDLALAIGAATKQAVRGLDLTEDQARAAIGALLDERAEPLDAAALLTALAAKGPSALEIATTVRLIRAAAAPIDWSGPAVDVVGSGGDGSDSINISTIAGLLAAAAGATVAKAGNRAATSRCGSADVLERLGVPLGPVTEVADRLARNRFAFLFSPAVHPVVGRLSPIRKRLGFRTLFNLAGPLANPVALTGRLVGAADRRDQEILAEAALLLGMDRTWVVHGHGGLDELTTTGPNQVLAVSAGRVEEFTLDPAEFDLLPADAEQLRGGGAERNAAAVHQVLAGRAGEPVQDTCVLNAAAALLLAGEAADLAGGIDLARAAIADGSGTALLRVLSGQAVPTA
ncbi:anthranilate phosphoribosyltransferase [Kitasatospora sp. NPDC006697]|uniref:anthranilate phosphoribosyltransferase n=1 Tax=Kitasatospora sp. NPDC006697 TaxID=3364020 RepID=UPI0036C00352